MPNGKGQIDCCYCGNWQGEYEGSDAMYDAGFCKKHQTEIPSTLPTWNHRICADFEPNIYFEKYRRLISVEERFRWFGRELEQNVLYEFPYNSPPTIKKLKDL